MDTVKSHLETLSENSQGNVNYVSWKFKLYLTLKSKDLFPVATGVKVKPEGIDTNATVQAWVKQDLEAQTLIGLNVSSNIAIKISNCQTAYQMLCKLELLYGKKSDLTIEGLQRQFFNFKYDSNKSAIENCIQIQQYAEDLAAEGEDIKESWIMTRILGILPPKLHHFRTAWDNVSGVDKSLTTMFERLRLEEDRLTESKVCDESFAQNALMSKQSSKSSRTQSSGCSSSSVECFKCGMKGHVKKYCRNRPCSKYLDYCKKNFSCNKCNAKGHFAKDCPRENLSNSKDVSTNLNRRAFITLGLTTANVDKINSNHDRSELWYQDCAATQHMTSRRDWLIDFVAFEDPAVVIIGDATKLEGIGSGDVKLEAFDGNEWYKIILKNVLYVPRMTFNLFSVTQMLDKGYTQAADSNGSLFKTSDQTSIVAVSERDGNLFKMMFRQELDEKCMVTVSIKTWHERLAHQNIKYVRNILKKHKIKYVDDWNDNVCTGCVYGKQHRISHPINPKVAENILDMIHVDLCEMNMHSLGGAKYFLLLKDDFSHYRTVYFLRTKDEATEKLNAFMKMVENQFDRKVKCLRSDHGTEIKNADTRRLLNELGVFHTKSNVYTPQQNGRIEREMRTVVESARSAIHARDLNENLWAEAVNYAVFTINQTGTSSCEGKSPAELWFGRKMDIIKLKTFGSDCYVLIHDHKRLKTGKKSKKGIFVGYDLDSPCYRVYLPDERVVTSSVNVIFDEKTDSNSTNIEMNLDTRNENSGGEFDESELESSNYETPEEEGRENQTSDDVPLLPDASTSQPLNENNSTRRNLRDRHTLKKPERLNDYVFDNYFENESNVAMIGEVEDIPVSEALKNEKWRKAMTEEFKSLTKMKTWDLVKAPDYIKPLTCRWILRQKNDGRYKARLVARGFEQKEGIDYNDTFSPVVRYVSIRLILSFAASSNMKLMTFDVKTAFLYGDLQEEIFMYQPEGFQNGTSDVCKLNKSLYGLKQAPKNWNDKIMKFLKTLGLENTDDDPCVYYNQDRSMILALFVDDGLIAGKNNEDMTKVLKRLNREFEVTFDAAREGRLSYLSMQIQDSANGIFVNQPKYTEKILQRFKFNFANAASTPMERGMITDEENLVNDRPLEKSTPYREAIGSLLYLSTVSRPDISFAVSYLSRYCNNPMNSHWKMVKRIFQYLQGTVNCGILYNRDENLVAYTDSDYGGDTATRHSTSGVLIIRGGPIVWYAQKQRLVATSSAEAEYRAAVSSIDDICWIRRIGRELGFINSNEPTTLYVDNQSAIHMLKNTHEGKITKGKKHIEISRKFVQEHIGKTVNLKHVKSSEQLADVLTKPLTWKIFQELRNKIIKEEC